MARSTATRVGTGKARAAYDLAPLAWRAGVLTDFYYGKRSPSDPTVIWSINGFELGGSDHAQVILRVTDALRRHGIGGVSFGPSWCGYRSVVVRYLTGAESIERYDGRTVVIDDSTTEVAA